MRAAQLKDSFKFNQFDEANAAMEKANETRRMMSEQGIGGRRRRTRKSRGRKSKARKTHRRQRSRSHRRSRR